MSLDQDLFIGFDGAYLKSCMQRSPQAAVAKQCYSLYEESVYLGFTGSSGTHIPADIEKELAELRAVIYPAKGKKN